MKMKKFTTLRPLFDLRYCFQNNDRFVFGLFADLFGKDGVEMAISSVYLDCMLEGAKKGGTLVFIHLKKKHGKHLKRKESKKKSALTTTV